MINVNRIAESKQARALAWLRLTDYALVILCGFWVIALLPQLPAVFLSGDKVQLAWVLITLIVLCFAAYTGWRHVGMIDPSVWRAYRVLFPLLVAFLLFSGWAVLVQNGTIAGLFAQDSLEFRQHIDPLIGAAWIGGTSLVGWISLMLLRRMNITGLDVTVKLLFRLGKNPGVRAAQATDVKRINKPRGLIFAAAGALVLAVNLLPDSGHKIMVVLHQASGQLMTLLGFFLLVRARRYFQVDADSLLAVDRRSPILFLRSFDDDGKQHYGSSENALLDFSLETRLSNHFNHFGPFIAIGSPKETLPEPGAARVLLSDNEWQPRVLGWMRDAQLIIMYSGKTHCVNWELRKVLESKCATRLILLIPEIKAWRSSKRNKDIMARVEQVREVFRDTPWEEELLQFDDLARLRAMLFRPDGSMVMVKSRSRSRDSYHLAALVAHQILIGADAPNEEDEKVRKAHDTGDTESISASEQVIDVGGALVVGLALLGIGVATVRTFPIVEALKKGNEGIRAEDYGKAMSSYRKAADLGSAEAQNNIGVFYRDGHGVAKDYAQALSRIRRMRQ